MGVIHLNILKSDFDVKTDRMRPLWKTAFLSGCLIMCIWVAGQGQCSSAPQSVSYDTLIAGTGNNSHVFTLPQFEPSIGTLLSAKINSTISVNYGFTLKNVELAQRDFSVSVGRYDHYTSAALSSPYTNLIDTNIGNFILNPGDSVSKAPYTVLSNYGLNDSITGDIANFLGTSTVSFNYTPITYTTLTGSNVYYYSATASDTIHFSITYSYCASSILANDIIAFSAVRENNEIIKLSWTMASPMAGRNYEVEAGTDGTHFSGIALMADANKINYSNDYQIPGHAKGDIYFRIKIISPSGEVKYSDIKMVDIVEGNAANGISIYPNPCNDYINIVFNEPDLKNWDTWIYSSTGSLIQKNHFASVSTAHIHFINNLAAGVYFIKAESNTPQKRYLLSFMVR